MHISTLTSAILIVMIFLAIGGSDAKTQSEKLPGAKGPLYEDVGKAGLKVIGADVGIDEEDANPDNPPKSRIFPSGTKKLRIEAKFSNRPQTSWSLEVHNNIGKIEMGPGVVMDIWDPRTGAFVLEAPLNPKSGKFDDGPYQARVKLDDNLVLVINWEIGESKK